MEILESNVFSVNGPQVTVEFRPSADQAWQFWANNELTQSSTYPSMYAKVHKSGIYDNSPSTILRRQFSADNSPPTILRRKIHRRKIHRRKIHRRKIHRIDLSRSYVEKRRVSFMYFIVDKRILLLSAKFMFGAHIEVVQVVFL